MADELNQIPNNDNSNPAPAQTATKTSGLAVAGLVLGILAILGSWIPFLNILSIPFAVVGLALAIAGFVIIRKGSRSGKGIDIAALVLCALSLVLIIGINNGAAASINKSDSSSTVSSQTKAADTSSKTSSTSSSTKASTSASAASRPYEVSIDGVRSGSDYKGNPVAIVTFTWTNNSKEAAAFAYKVYPKCFQNGVECDVAITTDSDSSGYTSEVKPGYGTTFELAYSVEDDSDVTIEVGPLVSAKKEVWVEQTFSLS